MLTLVEKKKKEKLRVNRFINSVEVVLRSLIQTSSTEERKGLEGVRGGWFLSGPCRGILRSCVSLAGLRGSREADTHGVRCSFLAPRLFAAASIFLFPQRGKQTCLIVLSCTWQVSPNISAVSACMSG